MSTTSRMTNVLSNLKLGGKTDYLETKTMYKRSGQSARNALYGM